MTTLVIREMQVETTSNYLKPTRMAIIKNMIIPVFTAAWFTIAKRETHVHQKINKMWHIHTMEYYPAL